MSAKSIKSTKATKAERREKKKRPRMLVSGRSVFVIQRIKAEKKP